MRTRITGALSAASLLLTALWLALLIAGMARSGPLETFEQVLASVAQPGVVYYLTYANATLITLCVTALYAGLYAYCEPAAREWSLVGFAFVPVYCVLNLVAYLSQITMVPQLVALAQASEYQPMASLLLRLTAQQWPGSAVSVFNNLAYAVLGIPSLIFGAVLFRCGRLLRLGGALLAGSGVACIVGVVGAVLQDGVLGMGSLVGGVLFLLALAPLSVALLRGSPRARVGAFPARSAGDGRAPAPRTEGAGPAGAGVEGATK